AQNELEVAKLVTSLLTQDTHDVSKSGSQSSITSNLLAASSGASPPQQRATTSDILISSAQEMQGLFTPPPTPSTSEAPVLSNPLPQVVQITSSAQDFAADMRQPNVVTWSSPPLAVAQSTSDPRPDFTDPLLIYPSRVAVPSTPPVTTVTYHQLPAVSVPPSVVPPPGPIALGAPVHPQSHQVLYSPTSMAFPPHAPVPSPALPTQAAICIPQAQLPGLEMLAASAYGIPKPVIPTFETGRKSDFALLKMALDNLMNYQQHLSEPYKYQVLLDHLKLPVHFSSPRHTCTIPGRTPLPYRHYKINMDNHANSSS
ncbi:hypothetical protein M9458_019987, partial [Cirrhinus mrigala]